MTIWADKDRRKMLFAVFLHPIALQAEEV